MGDHLDLSKGAHEEASGLPEQLEHFERAVISEALRRHQGDVAATAKALSVPKQTLYDKLKRLKIATEEFRAAE